MLYTHGPSSVFRMRRNAEPLTLRVAIYYDLGEIRTERTVSLSFFLTACGVQNSRLGFQIYRSVASRCKFCNNIDTSKNHRSHSPMFSYFCVRSWSPFSHDSGKRKALMREKSNQCRFPIYPSFFRGYPPPRVLATKRREREREDYRAARLILYVVP